MRTKKICFLLIFAWMATCCPVAGQTEETSAAEILENYFRENEQPTESDVQEFIENLENLLNRPLNLNRATREDLTSLHLLNDLQIENFLTYRDRFGSFLSMQELQAVPAWELADIRRVMPFVNVNGDLNRRFEPWWHGFAAGENELLLRYGQADPPPYSTAVEGGPASLALRYRHKFDNRLRFGFTAEKDPGEAFFSKSNPAGFDFYSAHLALQNPGGWVKTVALGDFTARFGQGLLLQSGFALGKTAETSAIIRGGAKVRPYGSFGEAFFMRGAAATFRLGQHWEITALYSQRRRDSNVDTLATGSDEEIRFTSLQSSGLHRTRSEIADENALLEQVAGVSGTYQWRNGQVSVNGLTIQYDKPFQPDLAAYRKFVFTGKSLTGASIDYSWHRRNWYFFGETARSDNGATATTNGLLLGADRRVTLSALHRWLPVDYQAIYAAPFAEASGAANEQGLFLGADIRPSRPWQINVYADVWQHPWLRFGVDGPSKGREYLARVIWTRRRVMTVYALWKMENKERTTLLGQNDVLTEQRTGRFRLHAQYRVSPAVELRSRAEWTLYQVENQPRSRGFLVYQEAVFKKLGFPLSGMVRYAIFDTDDFETRVFAFENDIFSAFSVPAFAGRGSRWFVNLNWRVSDGLRLEGRFEQTLQQHTTTDGGFEGARNGWKLLARWQF